MRVGAGLGFFAAEFFSLFWVGFLVWGLVWLQVAV
jgi:hypothetical protein